MRVYSLIPVLAMASCVIGCFPDTTDGPVYYSDGAGGFAGDAGAGGNTSLCDKPKQIRLLDSVTVLNTPVEIRYDSLDRTEPREIGTKMPITKLEVGDVLHVDPIDPFVEETILIKGVDTKYHEQTGGDVRSLIAVFKSPHIVNAPGTTPIEDGCPEFTMPIQEPCENHGQVTDLVGSCWNRVCMYGEWVLMVKPNGSPCGIGTNSADFDGHCRVIGYTFGICDPNP